jgi:hypothetical protein
MALRRSLVVALALAGCKQQPSKLDPLLDITDGRPDAIDGKWTDSAWNTHAWRGVLVDDAGAPARPYSEIRILSGDPHELYVALYAADEDIEGTDAFYLKAGHLEFQVAPTGRLRDGDVAVEPNGLRVAVDADGTIDDPRDDDEEWVVELAIPRARIGSEPPFDVTARRCDRTKAGHVRCGSVTTTVR